jgi:hypothetical protein
LPADAVWRDKPSSDFPGSLWLPDTGYGELAPVMLDYFRCGLDKALAGRQIPLVFYCLKDCWMSWNAAKRALSLGYAHVAWYPEGSDGWAAAGPWRSGRPNRDVSEPAINPSRSHGRRRTELTERESPSICATGSRNPTFPRAYNV